MKTRKRTVVFLLVLAMFWTVCGTGLTALALDGYILSYDANAANDAVEVPDCYRR